MYPFLGAIATSNSDCHPDTVESVLYTLEVPPSDRWFIQNRLQELEIPCWCSEDNLIHVEVTDPVNANLVYSVFYQFSASRQDLIDWLTLCWDYSLP